jgi:hypothetical protein
MARHHDALTGTTVISFVEETWLQPQQVLEAAYDFSLRRSEVFTAVPQKHFRIHSIGESTADVTEGTGAGIGINWERCRYDWSQPNSVTATVIDSNVYAFPGSLWEIRAVPRGQGSSVEMIWTRRFTRNVRGRFFGLLYRTIAQPMFHRYVREILENLEKLEAREARIDLKKRRDRS